MCRSRASSAVWTQWRRLWWGMSCCNGLGVQRLISILSRVLESSRVSFQPIGRQSQPFRSHELTHFLPHSCACTCLAGDRNCSALRVSHWLVGGLSAGCSDILLEKVSSIVPALFMARRLLIRRAAQEFVLLVARDYVHRKMRGTEHSWKKHGAVAVALGFLNVCLRVFTHCCMCYISSIDSDGLDIGFVMSAWTTIGDIDCWPHAVVGNDLGSFVNQQCSKCQCIHSVFGIDLMIILFVVFWFWWSMMIFADWTQCEITRRNKSKKA